jgi:hypothetical protein
MSGSTTKSSGLGDDLVVAGYHIGGDVQDLSIASPLGVLDVTDITQYGHSRLAGLRSASMDLVTFHDPAANMAHDAFKGLPTADVIMTYLRGTALGGAAASLNAKQVGYDPTRSNDGSLTFKVQGQSNSYNAAALDWAVQLTPGVTSVANLLTGQNAGFEGGVGNWVQAGGCTVADSSAQAHSGSDSLALTCTTAGTMGAASCIASSITTQGLAVTAGQLYTVQMYLRAATAARTSTPQIAFYSPAGTLLSTVSGSAVADVTTGWTLLTVEAAIAPATAVYARVLIQVASAALTEVHYLDDVSVFPAPGSVNNGQAYGFGAQAYLHVPAFTGTDVTVQLQHAPDGETWTELAAFSQVTGSVPLAQRLCLSGLFTCPVASPGVFTAPGPVFLANQAVQLSALPGQSLPGGFAAATTYYVISPAGSTFGLAATPSGSPINATTAGSGVVGAVVDQYLQAALTTVGGFTALSYEVNVNVNPVQVVF